MFASFQLVRSGFSHKIAVQKYTKILSRVSRCTSIHILVKEDTEDSTDGTSNASKVSTPTTMENMIKSVVHPLSSCISVSNSTVSPTEEPIVTTANASTSPTSVASIKLSPKSRKSSPQTNASVLLPVIANSTSPGKISPHFISTPSAISFDKPSSKREVRTLFFLLII